MKKIGIITFYHKNNNYGGVLQAYALEHKINRYFYEKGVCCEQIAYDKDAVSLSLMQRLINFYDRGCLFTALKKRFGKCTKSFCKTWEVDIKGVRQRNQLFEKFRLEKIKHSAVVYDAHSIKNCTHIYDGFICGSDQIWNPIAVRGAYLLTFVNDKPKFAYAASMAVDKLKRFEKIKYSKALVDFKRISVRENAAVLALKECALYEPTIVLDPTLLLTVEEWDEIATDNLVCEDYIFCYFLGEANAEYRKSIQAYAKNMNLKIVYLPYLNSVPDGSDNEFGDLRIYNIGPSEFVSLIKYSKLVITDSFHAVVFSGLYHKEFLVYRRTKDTAKNSMNSRIYDFLKQFHFEEMLLNDEDEIDRKCYAYNCALFDSLIASERKKSVEYLVNCVNDIISL